MVLWLLLLKLSNFSKLMSFTNVNNWGSPTMSSFKITWNQKISWWIRRNNIKVWREIMKISIKKLKIWFRPLQKKYCLNLGMKGSKKLKTRSMSWLRVKKAKTSRNYGKSLLCTWREEIRKSRILNLWSAKNKRKLNKNKNCRKLWRIVSAKHRGFFSTTRKNWRKLKDSFWKLRKS